MLFPQACVVGQIGLSAPWKKVIADWAQISAKASATD